MVESRNLQKQFHCAARQVINIENVVSKYYLTTSPYLTYSPLLIHVYFLSFQLIGPQFVYAVKPSLKEHWTDEIEESWLQLFRYISYIMKRAMMETYTSQEIPVDNKT
ncbi:hypothetical protein CDAR_601541 [Caerostris darwini]|uniref:Uncharacterized protein n=1 Tax=Caerostris darwini TaxID=1538125 RepID=A0AAV4N1S7_9ARAC|nr:hypothetical protein CDAR_601541 [Caerostris darwini]